jgi:tripartite-type tricarboxylate transporter receptor subunit TctC
MEMKRARLAQLALGLIALSAFTPAALAQADAAAGYPKQPIKMLVGFSPGGSNDILARIFAQKLGERLGQPGVVENKPGAGGRLAAETLARSAPDGHTLLMVPAGTLSIAPAVFSKLNYDSVKSFAHVAIVATYPFLLSVNAGSSINSVKELIAFAKANPAKANYGSTSPIFQLTSELFNLRTGVKFEHIPFKSGGEIVAGILNGQVTMAFADAGPAMPQINAGKLRVLATSGAKRFPALPSLPTMKEAGIDGVVVDGYSGIVAPAGTPAAIVKKLERETNAILEQAEVRDRMTKIGLVPGGGTSEAFVAVINREIPIWKDVATKAKIKLD